MHDRVCPPRRMRFSFESRCRLVSLILAGDEPAGGRGRLRREPRDRLSALAPLSGGRLGGACRSAAGAEASAAAAAARARAADPGRARVREGGPADRRRAAGAARLDRLEGASPPRRLAAAAACARPGRRYERAAAGRARARRHQEARPLLDGRQAHPRRRGRQPQPPRRLAVPAPRDRRPLPPRLRRAAPEREPRRLRRLPPPRRRLVRRARDHGRARAHRQRQRLPLTRLGAPPAPSSGSQRRYTRPRRPQTNGKAEALVKTLLREWAYRFAYPTSAHRARALPGYLRWYNQHRPHSSLGGQPPISRVSQVCGSRV